MRNVTVPPGEVRQLLRTTALTPTDLAQRYGCTPRYIYQIAGSAPSNALPPPYSKREAVLLRFYVQHGVRRTLKKFRLSREALRSFLEREP